MNAEEVRNTCTSAAADWVAKLPTENLHKLNAAIWMGLVLLAAAEVGRNFFDIMSNAGAFTIKLDSLKVSEGIEGEGLGKLLAERASTGLAHDVARSFRNGYKLEAGGRPKQR